MIAGPLLIYQLIGSYQTQDPGPETIRPGTDPLAPEKSSVSQMEKTFPTTENVKERLEALASAYEKAIQHKDHNLAQKCQFLAIQYVLFIEENNMNRDSFSSTAARLGIHIPATEAKWKKAFNGNYSALALAQKAAANMAEPGHYAKYTDSPVITKSSPDNLAEGLKSQSLFLITGNYSPTEIGKILSVPPESKLTLGYSAKDMASWKTANDRKYIVFSSANYTFDKNIPATLSIADGTPSNLYVSPAMHGFVVIKDGRPEIYNLRTSDGKVDKEALIKLVGATLSSGGTIFQTNLLVYEGKGIVPKDKSSEKRDVRRVLAAFEDGSYAIIQINESITLFELSAILEKIPGLKSAVNLDTGGCNVGGYRRKGAPKAHNWGNNTTVKTSTLLFIYL